jgi:Coenzyme PQQ synthesis protein D (PqqD)
MITLGQKLRPHSQVVDTTLDEGEAVLLHLDSKIYYSLNLTGERIWRGLKEGQTLKEISQHLAEDFEVDTETADRSVLELVNELIQQKLVWTLDDKEEPPSVRPWKDGGHIP